MIRPAWRRTLSLLIMSLALIHGAFAPVPATRAAEPRQIVDDFEAPLPIGVDPHGVPLGFLSASNPGGTTTFARTAEPAPRPDAPANNQVLRASFNVGSWGVVIHNFTDATRTAWTPQDWSAYAGIALWMYGTNSGNELFLDVLDNRNEGSTRDDAERFTVAFSDNFSGWQLLRFPFESFVRKDIGNSAPNDGFTLTSVHGYAFGALSTAGQTRTLYIDDVHLYGVAPERPLAVAFTSDNFAAREGQAVEVRARLSKAVGEIVTVGYTTVDGTATAGRDYVPASGMLTFQPGQVTQSFTVQTLDDSKYEGNETVLLRLFEPAGANAQLGIPRIARITIQDTDRYDPALIDDFERDPYLFDMRRNAALRSRDIPTSSPLALPEQTGYERVLEVSSSTPGRSSFMFGRRFAGRQDWSNADGLRFWYYGRNTGRDITVTLLDNATPDPGPAGWQLVWSDEFNARAGTPPNPDNWGHEIGDGTINGIPGWGNSELQYYTDRPENVTHDGRGHLVITARRTAGSAAPDCYYGPCQYTSARLLSAHRVEFAYGRIEARIKVPGGAGLWPAFWALGANIDRVGWPQSGEIDIMEFVGRNPTTIFGTIHGPGYAGGQSFGGTYDFNAPVPDAFHTYAVEWQPGRIVWYVDGIKYHEATPDHVAPNPWVFDHGFFLLLNMAVGGNFGGPVGADTQFPASMLVDYVRVYQAADTAERFESRFSDNFSGWREITLPFSSFRRAGEQPAGAPKDGLTLTEINGYAFTVPGGYREPVLLDQVRLAGGETCPRNVTVSSAAESGVGSLREALTQVCDNGAIRFAASLTNATISLQSPLTIDRAVTIDGSSAPGLTISGGGATRVFVIDAGSSATIRSLRIANGYGFELAGAILNNGNLTLDRVTVENSLVTTSGVDFWKGGAGIYNGEGSRLVLQDSTVRGNEVQGGDGGGVYAFFNTVVAIERSTISGNTAGNVGGGLRTLGTAELINSTVSGNRAVAWHGGGIFHTNGVMSIRYSTIADNSAPDGTAGGVFVGTFTEAGAALTYANSIVARNSGAQCFLAPFGSGAVSLTSGGHNLVGDTACFATGSDLIVADPRLDSLADNGGPTLTHALQPASPALDAADAATCPATDQRGVRRPQGSGCDIGAVEMATP